MLTLLTPERAQRLRSFLSEAGYSDEGFRRRPMLQEFPSIRAGNIPYLLDYTREPSALNLLLRLFLFGMPVDARTAERALAEDALLSMMEAGMLTAEGDVLTPAVMLTPCNEYYFAADSVARLESDLDAVLYPNETTRTLQMFALRTPSRATLDLGAGCGILSILAASHSERVAATDLNPRAAEFTAFNARLNGMDNIECYTGDTFEPVQSQTFDLILANPPFFVTPSSSRLYCENSMELDGYCRRVVRESAGHLNEGGYLQMAFEWVQIRGQAWQERLAEWAEGTGCDVWIVRSYAGDPESYAFQRTRNQYAKAPERTAARYEELVAYYRERGVEQISGGLLAMRRRNGANWLHIEEALFDTAKRFGDSVPEVFSTRTALLALHSDEGLALLKPKLAGDSRLDQARRMAAGKWAPGGFTLSRTEGLPASLNVEPQVAEFLARCDGAHTLEELAQELAVRVKAPPEQVLQQCCAVVRKLAERRFILL